MTAHVWNTALLGAPWQMIVLAMLVLGLFAPHLLPKAGRLLGKLVRSEALRRLGLSSLDVEKRRTRRPVQRDEAHTPATPPLSQVEVIMPERPAPTLRAASVESIAPRGRTGRSAPIWVVSLGVIGAASLIFWLLLHAR